VVRQVIVETDLKFDYYGEGEVMFYNGRPMIKGIPAKLFLYILREHLKTGKTIFFLSEFRKARSDLGKILNLEIRLGRLSDRIAERVTKVRLMKGRGIRILESEGRIALEEK
jgi:hypothetical protein